MICYRCLKQLSQEMPKQHGLHEACFREWFALNSPEDFSNVIVKSSASREKKKSDDQFTKNSSFFHGKFKKYSANLGGVSYILKVKDQNYPELPATEYLCNQIASCLGLNIPSFYFMKFEDHLETFVMRNFMQDHSQSNLVHIYHYLQKDEEFNCENLLRAIEKTTGRLADIERFLELCLFDSLTGNNDRHGRNLAFIQTKKGLQLSPFYDNPSYLGTEEEGLLGAQIEPAGAIATSETREPKIEHYVAELIRLGYEEAAVKFQEKVSLKDIFALVEQSFISQKRKQGMRALMERRFKELEKGVGK